MKDMKVEMELLEATLIKVKPGLIKYQKLLETLHAVDVSKDSEFQRAYNGFYRTL
ncbi:hypothetical protein LJC07_04240 [Christensenellaceae bacterium OttesenSCG-928-L17]|nr:hypothetical protein [Christensenellaceae bacterium OttesenSCG-928-L17]